MKLYLGIDNGVSGYIAAVTSDMRVLYLEPVPTIKNTEMKKTKTVNMVDYEHIYGLFDDFQISGVMLERPMINGMRFTASVSGAMAYAVLDTTIKIALSDSTNKFPYQTIDSKVWQKALLGSCKGETKTMARQKAEALYPAVKRVPKNKADTARYEAECDAICIAEYCRRTFGGFTMGVQNGN